MQYLDAVDANAPFSISLLFRRFEAAADISGMLGINPTPGGGAGPTIDSAINLPLPNNLTENYEVAYNSEDNTMQKFIAQIISEASGSLTSGQSRDQIFEALGASAAKVLRDINPSDAGAFAAAYAGGLGFGGRDLGLDYVFNPSMSNVFEGVTPRSFQFTWKVYPQSAEESQMYMDIVNSIKYHILPPEAGSVGPFKIVRYPDVVDIDILAGGVSAFPIQTAVVTDFNVNYGPTGMPTFFVDDKPTHIEFTMNIREAHSLTRDELARMGSTFGGRFL